MVGLIKRSGQDCTVRAKAAVAVMPCDQLGVRHLSASQTYVEGPGPAVVRGRVRKLHKTKSYWYLNFGEYWRQDFSIQIPIAVVEQLVTQGVMFDQMVGSPIQAYGRLGRYNGPSLRVETSKDLQVLRLRKGSSPWR